MSLVERLLSFENRYPDTSVPKQITGHSVLLGECILLSSSLCTVVNSSDVVYMSVFDMNERSRDPRLKRDTASRHHQMRQTQDYPCCIAHDRPEQCWKLLLGVIVTLIAAMAALTGSLMHMIPVRSIVLSD